MTLIEIREELSKFKIVQCGMYHERVARDKLTNQPIKVFNGMEEVFQRVNLCDDRLRKWRLGCAHTRANYQFQQLLEEIAKGDTVIEQLAKTFDTLILKVYQLDHQKGDLEKHFAESLDLKHKLSTEKIQIEIKAAKQQHREYMNQLKEIQLNIITHIDAKIASEVIDI